MAMWLNGLHSIKPFHPLLVLLGLLCLGRSNAYGMIQECS